MGKYQYIALFAVAFLCHNIYGQKSVGLVFSPAKIIKHTPKIKFDIPPRSMLYQVSLYHHTTGQEHWHRYWNRPKIGVHIMYLNYGNDQVLGKAFGLFPTISVDIIKHNRFLFSGQIGSGIAYLTNHYDKITNPTNIVIGSMWNNVSQMMLKAEVTPFTGWNVSLGGHLTHCSNARTVTPNLGINTTGLILGLTKTLNRKPTNEAVGHDTVRINRKWGADLLLGYGLSQYSFTGGSNYGSYFINLGAYHKFSPFVKGILGGEYEYNQSIFQFYYQDFDPASIARQKATKTALYGACELSFGLCSIRFQRGYYLPLPSIREENIKQYNKICLLIRPFPEESKLSPYVGVLLKTHAEVAQYLGLVGGVTW